MTSPLGPESMDPAASAMNPLGVRAPGGSGGPTSPCEQAQLLITEALEPQVTFVRLSQIRVELQSMNCAACVGALDTEVKFRSMLATSCTSDAPPAGLAMRITETLAKVDLSQLDVNDIEF